MCTGTDLPRCCFLSVELCFLKAILLCHPFVEVHWLCARPSQGGVLRSAFGSPTVAVWVCARLILVDNRSENAFNVLTTLGWERADLHPAIRWSKCSLLFYCLGNCTEREVLRSAKLRSSVRTCKDSCTSGKGKNWGWQERNPGEGV